MDHEKKVVLFGRTGAGKSTVGNVLVTGGIVDVVFPTSDAAKGCTDDIHCATGRGWTVTDTVGLGEAEVGTISNVDAKAKLTKYLRDIRNEYSHIIFVQKATRLTTVDEMIWLLFASIFEGAEEAFVVLFTGESENWLRDNKEKLPDYFRNQRMLVTDIPPVNKRRVSESRARAVREKSMQKLQDDLEEHFRERDYQYTRPSIALMTDTQLEEKAWSLINYLVEQIKRLVDRVSWLSIATHLASLVNIADFMISGMCLANLKVDAIKRGANDLKLEVDATKREENHLRLEVRGLVGYHKMTNGSHSMKMVCVDVEGFHDYNWDKDFDKNKEQESKELVDIVESNPKAKKKKSKEMDEDAKKLMKFWSNVVPYFSYGPDMLFDILIS